jgi:hypothetical protein
MTGEPLRIGILGAARITELALIKPAALTGTRLVAVAARDRSRAEAFADQPNGPSRADGFRATGIRSHAHARTSVAGAAASCTCDVFGFCSIFMTGTMIASDWPVPSVSPKRSRRLPVLIRSPATSSTVCSTSVKARPV